MHGVILDGERPAGRARIGLYLGINVQVEFRIRVYVRENGANGLWESGIGPGNVACKCKRHLQYSLYLFGTYLELPHTPMYY